MSKKITQKDLKHDEFVDAAFDFGHWLESNWKSVVQWLLAAVVLAAAGTAWVSWSRHSLESAKQRLAESIGAFEKAVADGSAGEAELEASAQSFSAVASSLSGKAPGRLASYYEASAYFELGRYDEAKTILQAVIDEADATETVGAVARWMLARVEISAGREPEAIALLEDLAGQADAVVPPDQALIEIGRIHASAGRDDDARFQWQRVVDEYPESVGASEARTLLR